MEPQKESNPNYLPYPPQSQSTDDEIDLRELFKDEVRAMGELMKVDDELVWRHPFPG